MINLLNLVYEIETKSSMQKLVNKISAKYGNQIEYIQCDASKKVLYVVFSNQNKSKYQINKINEIPLVSNISTNITLLGLMIKQIRGKCK